MSNNYETYEVRVYTDGTKQWLQNDKLHRLNGPAYEYPNGTKGWWIEGKQYSEQAFNQKVKELTNPTCNGKMVEIEGKKYRLQLIEE